VPGKRTDFEVRTLAHTATEAETNASLTKYSEGDSVSFFTFDPNSATFADLTSLGIPGKVAATLIKYRNSGGRFRKAEDIQKIYGMDTLLAKRLIPYINIANQGIVEEMVSVKVVKEEPELKSPDRVAAKININRSDSLEVDALPGIGRVLSARIIKYRELLGGYVAADQLKEVYGLSDSVFNLISGMILIDPSVVRKIDINNADFRVLGKHPYLERYDVQAILKYREIKGRIEGPDEFLTNKILTKEKMLRIKPYLIFN
jgi:DNA uptake protein ComE-like DNA-binding protein